MVVLAKRYRTAEVCKKQCSPPNERESTSTVRLAMTPTSEASDGVPERGELSTQSRRTEALSLTLTYWTPVKHHDSLGRIFGPTGDVLTARSSGPRSRVMTSALVASPPRPPPLTMAEPSSRIGSLASIQHATDRFPRSTYLLRTGTPKREAAEEELVRRSADPGETQVASLATVPDPPAQCGTGDKTCMQSCVASGSSSPWGPSLRPSSSPSRASTPTILSGTIASVPLTSASVPEPLLDPAPRTMASNSTTTPRSGAGTPRLPVPTRRNTDGIAGERIMPGTPLSTSPQSQGWSDYADGGMDVDDSQQDDAQAGASNADGQPKKRKTRRAGVAITRVRRMQREVRKLAEEEDQAGMGGQKQQQQQQQPQRSLLSGVQGRPSLPPMAGAPPPLSLHIPQYGQSQQQQRALSSPSTLSATRPSAAEGRHARSEPNPAAHSRAATAAYDQPPRTETT
ncbi:hypothetical protein BC628DRAFT_532866 [Trametes gibbosa]|nr:hypothetical protein BC628DRAFT_532866 [Trametes gibbosa]